jgi:hypothetical protein
MIVPGQLIGQPGGLMNIRTLIAGIGTAAVVLGGGLVLTGTAASAQGNPHTAKAKSSGTHRHKLTLTAVTTKTIGYGKAYITEASADYNTKGRLVGFDVLHFTENPSKRMVTADGAFDMEDGIIDITFATTTSSSKAAGEVIGGTGAYLHATGTITATTKSSSKTAVTIVYTTK